ncbi:hypothetical protein Zm00014a_024069 [Zea mays]|uniref:Uncharacterized protein n=1 Tax=Zea mays TaxID=4577 RepID=A0A3L6EAG2_MAIZE|nr:hypothetical protein Zm00014a_024069 [Zea mays]
MPATVAAVPAAKAGRPPTSLKAKRHRHTDSLMSLILTACQRHERCTTASCTLAKAGGPLLPLAVTVAAIKLVAVARRRTAQHPADPSDGAPDPPQEAVEPTDGVSKGPLGPPGKSAATSRMARPSPNRDALPPPSLLCRASGPQLGRRRGRWGGGRTPGGGAARAPPSRLRERRGGGGLTLG